MDDIIFSPIRYPHQHLYHRINRRQHFSAGHVVVVAENGEHKPLARLRLSITGERVHMAERSGFGLDQSRGGRVQKTVCQ